MAEELSGVEKDLQSFAEREGVVDLGREADIYLSQSKENMRRQGEIAVHLDVLREIEKYVTQRNSTASAIPATLGLTDPVLVDLLNDLYESEAKLERIKRMSGPGNREIPVLEDAIAKLRPSIAKSIENLKINLTASRQQLENDYRIMSGFA